MRKEISNWWKQAEADLKSSDHCITSGDYYLSVFASQQAVEKALKSLCLLKLREVPKGHSILYLSKVTKVPNKYLSGIRELNPEYLTTRYPDIVEGIPAELYDKTIAKHHHKTAKEVLDWVKKQIQK